MAEKQPTNKTNKTLNDKDQRSRHLVYLADDDSIQAEKLAAQIAHFGYQVETFQHPGRNDPGRKTKNTRSHLDGHHLSRKPHSRP